jgi:hypothetical protein
MLQLLECTGGSVALRRKHPRSPCLHCRYELYCGQLVTLVLVWYVLFYIQIVPQYSSGLT